MSERRFRDFGALAYVAVGLPAATMLGLTWAGALVSERDDFVNALGAFLYLLLVVHALFVIRYSLRPAIRFVRSFFP